ncbi:hypothetical protein C8F01DRAFT_1082300 [Mycena amicta]|nr:hypothetical protein C8F01DRAFT_1082300 [Mycena amicta]
MRRVSPNTVQSAQRQRTNWSLEVHLADDDVSQRSALEADISNRQATVETKRAPAETHGYNELITKLMGVGLAHLAEVESPSMMGAGPHRVPAFEDESAKQASRDDGDRGSTKWATSRDQGAKHRRD